MIKVEINQKILLGGQKIPRQSLDKISRLVSQKIKSQKDFQVSLAFVSPSQIKRLNRDYRGQNRITDVLSFTFQKPSEAKSDEVLGEILICYSQAKKNALADGASPRQEVYRLIIHGLLHLFGYEHQSVKKAKQMFALQEQILKQII